MHRLRCIISGRGYGPKRRFYWAAKRLSLTTMEWKQHLRLPAKDGGLGAQEMGSWEEVVSQHLQAQADEDDTLLPFTREIDEQAWVDTMGIVRAFRRAGKRKAVAPWSAPVEAWLSLLRPRARLYLSEARAGVGAEVQDVDNSVFRSMFRELLVHIRRSGHLPLA